MNTQSWPCQMSRRAIRKQWLRLKPLNGLKRVSPERQVVGSRWVFKIKRTSSGAIEKYRARVVAKGYTEVPGIDFFETYAPTIRKQTFFVILALAAKFDLELVHFDVKSAFLHPVLRETIYMEPPPGFHLPKPGLVWQLLRSLYGLKQAAREWYSTR